MDLHRAMAEAVKRSLQQADTHRLIRALISRTTKDRPHGYPWGPGRRLEYLEQVHGWLESLSYYDEAEIEAVATIPQLLEYPAADCDDTAAAAYALTAAVGMAPALAWARRPGYGRHVWTVELTTGMGLDPAVPWGPHGGDPREELRANGWRMG